ncbi:MAG: HlyC/CorC family transporter [Leptolinea sp.]|jgi:putative hemolysin|nr:HlyC/CorC family transporter [Leptolinea sp.]
MNGNWLEAFIIFLLIVLNGLFAMTEIALVSVRKSRIEQQAEDGNRDAKTALELITSPNRFLSTVQVGISLVGVFAGALGGASFADGLAVWFDKIPGMAPYSHAVALVVVVLIITYFSLVIGELIPKRLALQSSEKISLAAARPMKMLARLVSPVVNLLAASTELGLKLLGVKGPQESPVSDEEIMLLVEQARETGAVQDVEQDMVESVFRLGDRRADAIMTPRVDLIWLDIQESLEINIEKVLASSHSLFPVGDGSLDEIIGIVRAKELVGRKLNGEQLRLEKIVIPPLFVPESMPALKVLELLKTPGNRAALVIDEYGGLQGLITLSDVLQAIIGDVPTPGELFEPQVVEREDGSYLFDGQLQIDELKDILDLDELPEEDHAGFQTLGGFMMNQLGEIPTAGQHFEWEGLRFEVVDMDGRRVDKVLVQRLETPEEYE